MAIMPGAVWRPLPNASKTRLAAYDITCIHTMVGSLAGTDSYFRNPATGVNSHFGTGGDGTIYQWVDTAYRSAANLNGNDHIVSIENADMGPQFAAWNTNDGNAVPAFPPAQMEAIAKILAWVNKTHGIPLGLIPNSVRGNRGTGYHRQGIAGYMAAGGEKWSNAAGKVCPGNRRVAQIQPIIDRARQIAGGATTNPEELTVAQYDEIMKAIGQVRNEAWQQHTDAQTVRAAYHKELVSLLVGNNAPGRNNFNYLDDRIKAVLEALAAHDAEPTT
jgi:N-acetylmuramoyl-L-alanine amidase